MGNWTSKRYELWVIGLEGLFADTIAIASCFNFLATAQKKIEILLHPTNGTFAFAPTLNANASAKAKEPFFPPHREIMNILEREIFDKTII